MRFGVEARVPFLDHRFVEFAFNLPTKYKLSGVQRKILLKAIGSKSLPPSLKNAPKMGFDLPMERWMKGPLNSFIRDNFENLKTKNFVNPNAVDKLFKQWESGHRSYRGIWLLASLNQWLERDYS